MLPSVQKDKIIWIAFSLMWILHLYSNNAEAQFAGGSGTVDEPYQVETLEQLQAIADSANLDKHYVQVADIDASETAEWNEGKGFEPIGRRLDHENNHPFTGSYYGNGYSISNLFLYYPDKDTIGLFGSVVDAGIIAAVLLDIKVTASFYTGGLAGYVENSEISNSAVTGDITGATRVGGMVGMISNGNIMSSNVQGNISGEYSVGGLAGVIWDGKIINSKSAATISGNYQVGGICGSNHGTVLSSYATGAVSGDRYIGGLVGNNHVEINGSSAHGDISGSSQVGGLVGFNIWNVIDSYASGNVMADSIVGGLVGNNAHNIIGSYATGNVTGSYITGGLVGQNRGRGVFDSDPANIAIIYNSYAAGSVSGNIFVGGLIGWNSSNSEINQSYAIGKVMGNEFTGGFVGSNEGNISVGYWDTQTSSHSDGAGQGTVVRLKGLITDQMTGQNAFIHMYKLDFKETWQLTEGYPVLAWQDPDNPVEPPEVPIVSVLPEYPDFGEVETDSSHSMELLLKNKGTLTLSGEVLPLGTETGAFELIRGEGEWTLEPDSSRIIEIAFQPSSEDTFQVVLKITHDGSNESNPFEVTLTGSGKTPLNINGEDPIPRRVELLQNYPNPFNPVTQIRYNVPDQTHIKLEVYNAIGQRIATLVNEIKTPGSYEAIFDAGGLSSGVYLYRLQTEGYIENRQMLLIK